MSCDGGRLGMDEVLFGRFENAHVEFFPTTFHVSLSHRQTMGRSGKTDSSWRQRSIVAVIIIVSASVNFISLYTSFLQPQSFTRTRSLGTP